MGIERVYRDIRDRGLVARGDHIAVAFSGGPDSLCLLHVLTRLREALDLKLAALHVDHGLRPEGKDEVERARALAGEAGVPFTLLEAALDPEAPGNLQERARMVRRAMIEESAQAQGCQRIATGHTADDQAETVLMRAVRGAGPHGLGAMGWSEGWIIRPLLATTRRQVEEHLISLHLRIPPVRDPTNLGDKYFRNRIRHHVMPLLRQENRGVVRALCRLADICREEDGALEQLSHRELERATLHEGLDAPGLALLPAAMLPRVLLLAFHREHGSTRRLERQHVEQMVDLVHGPGEGTRGIDLPGVRLERRYDVLVWVARHGRETKPPVPLEPFRLDEPGDHPLPGGGALNVRLISPEAARPPEHAHLLDPEIVGFPLEIRPVEPGDRLETSPQKHRKVAKLLVDAKMPRGKRSRVPLVFYRNKLVLVVGVRAMCRSTPPSGSSALAIWIS